MRKFFTLAFCMLAITAFGQVRFIETESYIDSVTRLVNYKIDAPITQNINGGYGFKIKTPFEFTSFAFGWMPSTLNSSAGTFEIVYKVHKPGKGWTSWKTDEGFANPDETKSGVYKSDLFFGIDEYLHDSIEFYIHAPEGEVITELYIIIQDISITIDPNAIMEASDNSAKSCPEFPSIIPRSAWCGSYSACHNPTYSVTYRNATHTVIHHGASPDSYTDGYAVVRSYWNYHVNSNGWSDIGYNYLFDKYGNFFLGRHNPNMPNQDVHAAHAGSSNTYSIGLNFLGNSDASNTAPTAPQLQKCAEFLGWWYNYKSLGSLSSASILNQAGTTWISLPRICGHKDVNPGGTTCPGTALYALLPSIRTNTNQVIVDCSTPSDSEAPTTSITTDRSWYNSDFRVSFSDADNAGGTGVKYSFYQIMDFDGTEWRANNSKGFFNDNFTSAIHAEWTQYSGTWSINSNHIIQTNEISTNTNLYAMVEQQAGETYLYHWQQKISGSGSQKRSGMYFFCSDPTATGRGNSYMVYLRDDGNTAELYKYKNNSYETINGGLYVEATYDVQPNVWYDVKVILNTNTGEISLYINNNLILTTIDTAPYLSGNSISLRTGACQTEYDDIKVYKSRGNTNVVTTAENITREIRYQSPTHNQESGRIRTVLVDHAGNWSTNVSKSIFTDFDAPTTNISVAGEWQTTNFATNFTDIDDLSGIEKSFYNISDFNGTRWTSNNNRGYAYDCFDSNIGTEWISQTGNWAISNSVLVQNSETESNTNIYTNLQQDLSNRYLYEFDMKVEGTNSNKRAGFHYFSDNPSQPNRGNGYFVWFRLSTQELEFYKVTLDTFSLEKYYDININAAEWYNIKIVFDRITGESYVYMDNVLVGEYKDSEPFASGNYVSFRSGNSIMSVDNFKTYRTRFPNINVSLGNVADDIRYGNSSPTNPSAIISSITSDSAKNISAIATKYLNIDFDAPANIGTVNDGSSTDIDQTFTLNKISGNWNASSDANSGISAYYYAVGTTSGGTQVINWTNNGSSLSFTNNSVNLIAGTTYYISVKALNGAGLYSNVTTSDGVIAQILNCPSNFAACISDASIALSGANPTGGEYSGTGVEAGYFNPAAANLGENIITYSLGEENCDFSIYVNELPLVDCSDDIFVTDADEELTLSSGSPLGGWYEINGIITNSFNPATYGEGTYLVTYFYENNLTDCEASCEFSIIVTPFVSIINSLISDYEIYPNPNNGNFTIEIFNSTNNSQFEIANIQGQIVYKQNISSGESKMEINNINLSQGVYFARILSDYGCKTKKIVVK